MTRQQQIERAKALHAQGLTLRVIGQRLGVSYETVRRWLGGVS